MPLSAGVHFSGRTVPDARIFPACPCNVNLAASSPILTPRATCHASWSRECRYTTTSLPSRPTCEPLEFRGRVCHFQKRGMGGRDSGKVNDINGHPRSAAWKHVKTCFARTQRKVLTSGCLPTFLFKVSTLNILNSDHLKRLLCTFKWTI